MVKDIFNEKSIVVGDVNVYINEFDNYIADSFYILFRHKNYLEQVKNLFLKKPENRLKYYELLYEAFSHNIKLLDNVIEPLKENINIDSFASTSLVSTPTTNNLHLKDYHYLQRDWCKDSDKKQIEIITSEILRGLQQNTSAGGNALFLGAGTGRFAFDLVNHYDHCYLTDKSYSMAWHTINLMKGKDFTFFKPILKNAQGVTNVAKKYTAAIPEKYLKKCHKIEYFVADILSLPISSNSINAVFSIYFTDVVPFSLWYEKINKLIVNNGLFIHFGPLDYFHTDPKELLTADEFRDFFENNGYETLIDEIVDSPHLEDPNTMSYKVYRNWFFIARKKDIHNTIIPIKGDTIFRLNELVYYEKKGFLKEGKEEETEVCLELSSGIFNGADSVIQIFKLINGKNSFNEIITKLEASGFIIDDIDSIENLIKNFIISGVISIV